MRLLGEKYLFFVSSNFVNLFLDIIVNFTIQKLKTKHTSLKKDTNWAKLTEQNYYFFSFWGNERRKNPKYFAPKAPIVKPTSRVETPSTTTIKPGVKKKRKRKRHKLSHRSSSRHVFTNYLNMNLQKFSTKYYWI